MHLCSRLLPRPSASSPLDNRTHLMANIGQALDLEALHHEIHGMAKQMRVINENNTRLIQFLAVAYPPPPAASPILDIERSRYSHYLGDDCSKNRSTGRVQRGRRWSPSPPRCGRSSSLLGSQSSRQTPRVEGEEVKRRGRSPRHDDQVPRHQDRSTMHKIRVLDARIDTINTGTSAPITVDALIKQTNPLFTKRVVLEVEDPSDKVVVLAIMERLRPGPLFDSLSKNVLETLLTLQSKADKYIAVEELAMAKRKR
ncbi:hypothetical protein Acr_11g0009200 [Actinidia rufa]|uniref:Uncharacterized protein n=1 Tax=Actinidia rufa TaxID=165716 RepID=A0A7J0FD39_9ERIC|nr:hypothetical protein Acr_11g0009200 [Actinidia rufa]